MRNTQDARRAGLTLVEVLCVFVIVGLVMVAVLGVLNTTVSGIQRGRAALYDARLANGIDRLLRADFNSAVSLRSVDTSSMVGGGNGVVLAFFTMHSAFPLGKPSGSGVFRVEYSLKEDEDRAGRFTLYRREFPYFSGKENTADMPDPERVAEGLAAIRLRFFDGTQWFDTWQRTAMPYMTRVDVGRSEEGGDPLWETVSYFTSVASPDVDAFPETRGESK